MKSGKITEEVRNSVGRTAMKNMSYILLLAFLLVGCDAPQRTRDVPGYAFGENYNGPQLTSGFQGNTTGGLTSGSTTGGTTSGQTTSGTTSGGTTGTGVTPGFETCDLSGKYYASNTGYFGVCQSTVDETQFMFKPSSTDQSVRTCFIPTYKDQNGSSAYIGQPQCTLTTQNVSVTGRLYKTRSGFQQYPLNGVMVMKEPSLGAYFTCMDAYASYVSQACPYGARTSPACDQYARNYMAQKCNDFKATQPYVDIRLKN